MPHTANFCYMGSIIQQDGGTEEVVVHRINVNG